MLTGMSDVLRGICKVNTAKEEVKAEMEDSIRWRYNGSKGRSEAEMDGEQNGIREKKRVAELNGKKKTRWMEWWYYYPPALKPPWLISHLSPPFLFEMCNCFKEKDFLKECFHIDCYLGNVFEILLYLKLWIELELWLQLPLTYTEHLMLLSLLSLGTIHPY